MRLQIFNNDLMNHSVTDQDLLNAAAGGNLLTKTPKDALTLIENKSKVRTSRNRPVVAKVSTNTSTSGLSPDVAALTDAVKALLLKNTTPPPAFVKAVEESYQDNIQAYVSAAAVNYNQGNAGHRPPSVAHQVRPPGFPPVQNNQNRENNYNLGNSTYRALTPPTQAAPSNELANYMKVNETNMRAMQNQITNMKVELKNEFQATMLQQNNKLENMLSNYFQMNKPSGSGSGPLPSNTVANPERNKEKLFELDNTSVNENCSAVILKKLPEKLGDPGKFLIPCNFPEIVESLALADIGASINLMPLSIWMKLSLPELTPTQMILELADRSTTRPTGIAEDVFETLFEDVGNTSRYSYNDAESINRIDVIDIACEEYSQEVLGFFDNSESGKPTPISEPIIAKSLPSFTPFEGGNFILEEIEAGLANDSIPPRIDDAEFDPEGDILDEPPKLELKDLPSHLEYAFLEGTNILPVIIAKNMKNEEKECLIKVLKSHKQAIAWKLSDIKDDLRYFQIPIDPQDQEKTTFTCPYGTFAYRRMPFGLCNAPGTFQRCMMAIFHDMIEETMEVFMDDFSVFRDSFSSCLSHLDKMLKRCEDTNLVLKIQAGIQVSRRGELRRQLQL
ncbi:reverse transcriptase domain-containing protein [Tanacetum coccineum]